MVQMVVLILCTFSGTVLRSPHSVYAARVDECKERAKEKQKSNLEAQASHSPSYDLNIDQINWDNHFGHNCSVPLRCWIPAA